ncbi:MAG: alpha/beta hydrolase [Planctomycetes bacterium]|nr:alpha/beta hydrolase [Planctomycetota bacterium]
MPTPILYLPGLDGEARWIESTQQHLPGVELVPFSYPTGHELKWDELADLVASRMKSLGSGLLIGESFGGAVTLKTTILRPEAVRGLCLISSFSHEPEPVASAIGRGASRLLPKVVLNPVARLLAGWKLAGTLKGAEREKFLAYFEKLDHSELARRLGLLAGLDVSDRLVGVRCPVEIIYGSRDSIAGAPAQLRMWQRLPDARLRQLDGYGHMITQEVPIGVALRIEGWLQRVEAARAA